MGRIHIEALVDTGASATVINESTFSQVPDKDKVRLDTYGDQLGLTGATKHPLDIAGVYKIRMTVPELGTISPVVIVVKNISWPLILGMDLLQIYGANVDTRTMKVTWAPAGADERAEIVLARQTFLPAFSSKVVRANVKSFLRKPNQPFLLTTNRKDVAEALYESHNKGRANICLVNDSPEGKYFYREHILGHAIPVQQEQFLTLAELGQAGCLPPRQNSQPSEEKRRVIDEAIAKQTHLTIEQRKQLRAALYRQHEAVAESKFDMGRTDAVPHILRPKSEEPAYVKQFPIPAAHLTFIYQQVDELLRLGAIREDYSSPHNSPVFAVKKPHSNELRFVIDLRKVNEGMYDDYHSFMDVHQCLHRLGGLGANFMSALDLINAYWQLALHESSQAYTAFTVPGRGKFVWTVTPMGLKTSPSAFSRLMEFVFRGFKNSVIYLDDVLVGSKTWEDHIQHLEDSFCRLQRYNLKLNLKKCIFAAPEIEYLGYTISAGSIKPGKEKTQAVKEFPAPKTVKEIRRFTGLTNYFRAFIPGYAKLAGKLSKLLAKETGWGGGDLPPDALEAFKTLREKLIQAPILAFPQSGVPFTLVTDASLEHGYGGVLLQFQNGRNRAIAYFSRGLKAHEKNYSAYLLELGAAAAAIEHFHVYLYGTRFVLMCDHKPMVKLDKIHKRTLLRLQELMGEYDFQMDYLPGAKNVIADALSRAAVCSFDPLAADAVRTLDNNVLRSAQGKDSYCNYVLQWLRQNNFPRAVEDKRMQPFHVVGGILHRFVTRPNGEISSALVVPVSMQYELLRAAHAHRFAGHKGTAITLHRIREKYWWPSMTVDVDQFVGSCDICQQAKDPVHFKRNKEPLHSLAAPDSPWVRMHADLFTVGRKSKKGHKYVLVMTDAFSKLVELVPLPDKEAKTVAAAIVDTWVCRYACPKQVVTDRGKEFCNKLTDELYKKLGVQHLRTSAYHPQTNSSAESFNRELIKIMCTLLDDPDDEEWELFLPAVQFSYNTAVRSATNSSPFFLTYLCDPNLPYFQLGGGDSKLLGENWAADRFDRMKKVYRLTQQGITAAAARDAQYYNRNHSHLDFRVGDRVFVKHERATFQKVKNKKFVKTWKKAVVQRVLGATTYQVQYILPDSSLGNTSVVHRNRLKACRTREEEDLWTDVQRQQERREQGGETVESPVGGPLLAPAGRDGGLRRSGDQAPSDARVLDGTHAGKVSFASGQAAQGRVSRRAGRSSVRSAAALGGSDSDERISDSSVGRQRSPAAGGSRRGQRDGRGAGGAPLPGDDGSAAAAPRGLRRGLRSGGPVPEHSLPSRALEYKKYRRRHVSASSSGSDAGDSESGGEVAALDLHPHGRLPAQGDALVGGRRSPREDPARTALSGDGVREDEDAAALSSGQDDGQVAAGGAATRQQDAARCMPGDLAMGTSASSRWHANGQDSRGQASQIGDAGDHRGHRLREIPSAAVGGALHRQVHYEFHGNTESPLCCSSAGCSTPARRPEPGAGRARPVGPGWRDRDAGPPHCRLHRRPGRFGGAPQAGAASAHSGSGADGLEDVPGGDRGSHVPLRTGDGLRGSGLVRGDRGDALRGAAPAAPRRGFRLLCAAGFPTHFTVRSSFLAAQGGGLPGGDGGRSILPRADGGGVGFVPRAGCHPGLRWCSPEDAVDGRLSASAVSWRGCGSSSSLPGGARAGSLGPFWWGRGPSAAPFVDCRAPFIRGAVRQWHQAAEGLAVRSAHLPAGQGVQHRRGGILPGAVEEEVPVGRRRQDF